MMLYHQAHWIQLFFLLSFPENGIYAHFGAGNQGKSARSFALAPRFAKESKTHIACLDAISLKYAEVNSIS